MDILLEKSIKNVESAKILVEKDYYAPSVHCAYYGSFQYMKYTLKMCKKITYEKIEIDCKLYDGGSHRYIIDNILKVLRSKITNNKEYIKINRTIKDLKAFRIKSDYLNSQILYEEAEKSIKFSEEIIKTIKISI